MKRLILLLLTVLLLFTAVACGGENTTTDTTDTTDTTSALPPEGTVEEFDGYSGVVNDRYETLMQAGSTLAGVLEAYEFFGTGNDVTQSVNIKYPTGRSWYLEKEDGTVEKSTYQEIRKLAMIAAKVKTPTKDTAEITVKEVSLDVAMRFESVTAEAGSYLMLDFFTNLPVDFTVTVTKTEGGKASTAIYTEKSIPVTVQENGSCKGLAKLTVPHTAGTDYYLNLNVGKSVVCSMPIHAVESRYPTHICQLWLEGCWERVKDPDYLDMIIYEFYSCYPQILRRFAVLGNEPTAITVYIEDTDGVAWAAGNRIGIGLGWVNEKPTHKLNEIGFLSHELGHSAQQFAGKLNYGEDTRYDLNGDGKIDYKGEGVDGDEEWEAWFTEQMASYAGLRYYHWGTTAEAIDLEKLTPEHNYYFNWSGYGNCGVFFAYVDWYYPTVDKNGDGKITDGERGVIDALYWLIKNSNKLLYDNPYDPDIPFNQTVKSATGGKYANLPEIYEDFVKDMKSGAWVFTGFADYRDNFLSENIPGVKNPDYPVYKKVLPGDTTNEAKLQSGVKADSVVLPSGENVLKGATVVSYSGKHNDEEGVETLFDGDLETYWRATSSERNADYFLKQIAHGFVIDLGEVKTFDTYAMVNAGINKTDSFNTASWEILVSEDGKTWKSVDYQEDKGADAVTVGIGTQKARYIEVRIFDTDANHSGTVRIHEMVFVKSGS